MYWVFVLSVSLSVSMPNAAAAAGATVWDLQDDGKAPDVWLKLSKLFEESTTASTAQPTGRAARKRGG